MEGKAKHAAAEVKTKSKHLWHEIEAFFVNLWQWSMAHKAIAIPIFVAAVVVFVVLLSCCCYCCCCRKKQRKKIKEKLKIKSIKPGKFLMRIQPGRRAKQIMEDMGSMTFNLKYTPFNQMLTVKIIESNDIPVRDLSGHSYSFVQVKLLPLHRDSDTVYKTGLVRPATFNPRYGDGFTFCIPPKEAKEQVLYLIQYEKNRFSQEDGIGQVVLKMKSLLTVTETEYTKKISPYNPLLGLEKETGAVLMALQIDRNLWQLTIDIEEADILPEDEDKQKCASYISVRILNKEGFPLEKQKTATCSGTLQPEFDETMVFSLPEAALFETRILVKLKCTRLFRSKKLIGHFEITPDSETWRKLLEDGTVKKRWFQVYKKVS